MVRSTAVAKQSRKLSIRPAVKELQRGLRVAFIVLKIAIVISVAVLILLNVLGGGKRRQYRIPGIYGPTRFQVSLRRIMRACNH